MDSVLLGMISAIGKRVPETLLEDQVLVSGSDGSSSWMPVVYGGDQIQQINWNSSSYVTQKMALYSYDGQYFLPNNIVELWPTMVQFQTLISQGTVTLPLFDGKKVNNIFSNAVARTTAILIQTGDINVAGRLEFFSQVSDQYFFVGQFRIFGFSALGVPDGLYPITLLANGASTDFVLTITLS